MTKGIARQQLVVLRSANAIWQRVVRRLAAVVDVVLIDISEPTQNLLWEIEDLKRSRGPNWILVGRRDDGRRSGGPTGFNPGDNRRRFSTSLVHHVWGRHLGTCQDAGQRL